MAASPSQTNEHDKAAPTQRDAAPDVAEHGAEGRRIDDRLYMQLLAFGDCRQTAPLIDALRGAGVPAVLYADMHDPRGIAMLTISREPRFFVHELRTLLSTPAFETLVPKPELTMFGRTYALGYEQDLEETLFGRPLRTALNPDWPWAVWYPLRRKGAFEQLTAEQQREILMEHARIGMRFGRADLAHDIRLACHGLDRHDNDFLLGLMGRELHPLAALVQTMRRTTQTSQYIERLGPFFVGRAIWQAPEQGPGDRAANA